MKDFLLSQNGHGDYGAIFGLLIAFVIVCLAVEVGFVVMTLVLWKHLFWRVFFGILAIFGAGFILMEVWDFLR